MRGLRVGGGIAAAAFALQLAACGGGGGGGGGTSGGNPQLSMTLSTTRISVSASTADAAPTAQVSVNVTPSPPPGVAVYVEQQHTTHGIASVSGSGSAPITAVITFDAPAALGAGSYSDTVTINACFDQACTQPVQNSPQTVTVGYSITAATPVISSLNPSSATPGQDAFILTVAGNYFTAQSVVEWNGTARPTTFVSATQLKAQISAADIAAPNTNTVQVMQPGAPISGAAQFQVGGSFTLSITDRSPTQVDAGNGAFMLTVLGHDFLASSVVRWNGAARATTFVSGTEVIAQIPASDVASVGSATVDVSNGANGASNGVLVQITAPSKDAVSFQINPAHTGAVNFQSISFPNTSTWSVNLGAPASFALIAGGEVFVTAASQNVMAPATTVLALNATTGATVWSETVASSLTALAYDSGKLIVMIQTAGNAAAVQILDAATGQLLAPTAQLVGNEKFLSAPVARDGLIFVAGPSVTNLGDENALYAISEQTGAILWQQLAGPVLSVSTPAVTADGVYLSYASLVYAFRPLTGESIWAAASSTPPAGGGATGVVANGVFYAPDVANTYSGHVYVAETGARNGTFTADVPPAFGAQAGYFLSGGTLTALSGATTQWTFTGDGHLVTSPLVVGNYVIIGSSTGNLYAVNVVDGTQAWMVNVGAALPAGLGYDSTIPYGSLSAGDGLLLVPTGNVVTAYTLSTNP